MKVTDGGVGGRNLQFALACAANIAEENITVLSAGTDGVDGNSPATGVVVDGSTVERALGVMKTLMWLTALEKSLMLIRFFSARLGDVIVTGPLGIICGI